MRERTALFSGGFLRAYSIFCFTSLALRCLLYIAKWLGTIATRTRAYQQATGIDSLTSILKLTHPTFFSKHWFSQYAVATSKRFFSRCSRRIFFGITRSLWEFESHRSWFIPAADAVVVAVFSPSRFALEVKTSMSVLFTCSQYTYRTCTMRLFSFGCTLIHEYRSIVSQIPSKYLMISHWTVSSQKLNVVKVFRFVIRSHLVIFL